MPADNPKAPELQVLIQRWSDLLAVTSMADFKIWLPMDGYNGYNPPSEVFAGLHRPDLKNQDLSSGFSKLLMDQLTKCIEAQMRLRRLKV